MSVQPLESPKPTAASGPAFRTPARWDVPLDQNMTEKDVERLLALPPFSLMDPSRFPASASLRDILLNDSRIRQFRAGDIVVREGDYGSSAFFVLSGSVQVALDSLPRSVLGRREPVKKGFFRSIAKAWRNPALPEVRPPPRNYHWSASPSQPDMGQADGASHDTAIFLQDFPALLSRSCTSQIKSGEWFGEIAALGRTPRTATVIAAEAAELLEIRWQGLRDLRARDPHLKEHIDQLYRQRSLRKHLRETPIFRHLSDEALEKLAEETRFETHGHFDWHGSYKMLSVLSPTERLQHEPLIACEGDYPNGLILVRAGFARLSNRYNHGERTLSYLGRGQAFGFGELLSGWRTGRPVPYRRSLRALGYVDVLLVPAATIEELVLPSLSPAALDELVQGGRDFPPVEFLEDVHGHVGPEMTEFLVDNRFFNATAAMIIDLDRCTRCDDCVRACAAAHDNNPRFVRHGPQHNGLMVANACLHCVDPVCMIGCPTGAIHRTAIGGEVVINDATCIGCAVCANSCPYSNIQMVEIRAPDGDFYLDRATGVPLQKAAKCDLCSDLLGGPACARACPHDALVRIELDNISSIAQWLRR